MVMCKLEEKYVGASVAEAHPLNASRVKFNY